MSRASDVVNDLENELEAATNEVNRIYRVLNELEAEVEEHKRTIDDQNERIEQLEGIVVFVEGHYPDAIKAYDVRVRMEKASGNQT